MRVLAELVLRREGFEVIAVADGDAAFEAAIAQRPAVAVLDVSMPLMNGLETARLLREHPATHDVPIMLLTARLSTGA